MPAYRIGYDTCEESSFWEYAHPRRLSDEELAWCVSECLFAVLLRVVNKDLPGGDYVPVDFCNFDGVSVQTLMKTHAFQGAMAAVGFTPVTYDGKYVASGWMDVGPRGTALTFCDSETDAALYDYIVARCEKNGVYYNKRGEPVLGKAHEKE